MYCNVFEDTLFLLWLSVSLIKTSCILTMYLFVTLVTLVRYISLVRNETTRTILMIHIILDQIWVRRFLNT